MEKTVRGARVLEFLSLTSIAIFLSLLVFAHPTLGQESKEKSGEMNEAKKMCEGDPDLDWPKVNKTTGKQGVKGKDCWQTDKKTTFKVVGTCKKIKNEGDCEARAYITPDGKEHPVSVDGDNPIPPGAGKSPETKKLPGAPGAESEKGISTTPGTPLSKENSPLSAFKPKEWQGEGDTPRARENTNFDTYERHVVNDDGSVTKERNYNDGMPASKETWYADGSYQKTSYDAYGQTREETSYAPSGESEVKKYTYKEQNLDSFTTEKFRSDGTIEERVYSESHSAGSVEKFDAHGELVTMYAKKPLYEDYTKEDGTIGEKLVGYSEYFEDVDPLTNQSVASETIVDLEGYRTQVSEISGTGHVRAEVHGPDGKLLGYVESREVKGRIELWGAKAGYAPYRIFNEASIMSFVNEFQNKKK